MRLNRSGYLIREGIRSIGTHGFMSFASVTIIMACLIIMGSVSLLSVNIDALIGDLEEQNELVAFVDEGIVDETEAASIGEALKAADSNVRSVEFVSRADAMDNFKKDYDKDLMAGIDETVFRHRFVIHITDIALMAQSKARLEDVEGIAWVNAHIEYAKAFVTLRNIVSVVSLVLIVILVFVSVFIMSNTIKLATFGRREEIAIMKMVGATNSFIRMPFVVEGLVLGILGGGLAYLAQWGIYNVIANRVVSSVAGNFVEVIPFSEVSLTVLTLFVGAGILVGVFGGMNAIRNYLDI